ncbi:MAG: protoheme IX farnesyltransferase [Flavobacteriales bacterium CG_4_10_14_0_2_um_filter_32_8]|nr:MAG: protoheme IX farnesyltransferase [Flavobacteriales bacterium CG_4_10_14_0_2_um_filter_32_8]PJB15351.1 MAG: protoheme IX farnesyltransferase [Flavobacteriales bacterium CG_4_9_14_3_um_filter_32_8]
MEAVKTEETILINFSERLKCYAQLFKLRLTSFVVISAIFGYYIGASTYNFSEVIFLIIGGFFITCSSNAFNQIIEKDYDKLMKRTQNRPLPLNKFGVGEAMWVASISGLLGIVMLWLLNPLTGSLGALAIVMYVALYTPLKRISTISVFVGAFPGAFPPMLGWVAATGSFSLEAGILFAMQFLWQFPHFWAIAWKVNDDYTNAGFKMLPFGKKNKSTAAIILMSTLLLFLASFLPEYFHITGRIATIGLLILSLLMVYPAIKLVQTLADKYALRVMLMSYLYLILSLSIILIDRLL